MNLPVLPSRPECKLCELHEGVGLNGHVGVPGIRLPGLAPGPEHDALIFVGMNPGANENEKNEPFVGKSGHLLKNVLIEGFTLKALASIYLINGARCYTHPQSPPKLKHYTACSTWLLHDLQTIHAVHQRRLVICALGAGPVSILTKLCLGPKASTDLKKAIQQPARDFTLPNGVPITLFAAFHPAYILRNQPAIHAANDQFSLLHDHLTNCLPVPSSPRIVEPRAPRRVDPAKNP